MVNTDRKKVAKSPLYFNGKTYRLQEQRTRMWYDVEVAVTMIPARQYDAELTNNLDKAEYVLVYKPYVKRGFFKTKFREKEKNLLQLLISTLVNFKIDI